MLRSLPVVSFSRLFSLQHSMSSSAGLSQRYLSSKQSPRPKAVVFDMGGVIIPSPLQMFRDFEKSVGLDHGEISRIIVGENADGVWSRLEKGDITLEQFAQQFHDAIYKQTGKSVNVSPMVTWMRSKEVTSFPRMLEAIQCVRAEGIKTALLTNNWFLDENKAESLMPVDRHNFDVIVESCVVGVRKPHPDIYKRCCQELHVSPDQAVFLDDLGHNLKEAKSLGFKTIKVSNPEQAVSELEDLLGFPLSGYIAGTTTVPKHLRLDQTKLATFLNSIGLHDSNLPSVRVFEHGMSNPTYFVSYAGRKMVLRKKPPGQLLQSAHAVDREYRVMSAMSQAGVPVPNMIAFCQDESLIGTPFYLMDFIEAAIYTDISLPTLSKDRRRGIVLGMVEVLSRIHKVDIDQAQLSTFGKKGKFMERNFKRWAQQYELSKTSDFPSMNKLLDWIPKRFPLDEQVTVVHGDFRLDNLMLDKDKDTILAAIDWELSTLGDPITDLASCVGAYFIPQNFPNIQGLMGKDVKKIGLPEVSEIVSYYCQLTGRKSIDNWDFYLAFSFFRMAAILQGVYKRAISGQGSSSIAEKVGSFAETFADIGWDIASRSNIKPTISLHGNPTNGDKFEPPQSRSYSTSSLSGQKTALTLATRPLTSSTTAEGTVGKMAVTVEGLSPRVQELHRRVKCFVDEHVLPLDQLKLERLTDGSVDRWKVLPEVEELKRKAKEQGLWNLFLPRESDPEVKYGAGLTNLEYAFLCEQMGKSLQAPEIFNCSAPDTGNMETLVRYGTEEQKQKWLLPLLDGEIRSCFAMTEPQVASSDATNIESSIRRDGDYYVINGHKWWTSGALDPRCKICVFMGKTDTSAAKHRQQSMILVPMDSPGIKVVRPLSVFGFDDAPEGHGEVIFENVRVPASNMLLGEGRGFEIAQGRLGPGRIHHCMRLIGYAQRCLELMVQRTVERKAFGKPLASQGSIQQDVAKSYIEIDQCRLLVLKAAYMMDLYGNKVAAPEIAMIKVAAPNMALQVIDRAIQAHGGAGVSSDFPMASMYAWARALRLADGPDEVHMRSIARAVYAKFTNPRL